MVLLKKMVKRLPGKPGSRGPGTEDLTESYDKGMPLIGSAEEGFRFNSVKHSYFVLAYDVTVAATCWDCLWRVGTIDRIVVAASLKTWIIRIGKTVVSKGLISIVTRVGAIAQENSRITPGNQVVVLSSKGW